jgi:hypothetical protein
MCVNPLAFYIDPRKRSGQQIEKSKNINNNVFKSASGGGLKLKKVK